MRCGEGGVHVILSALHATKRLHLVRRKRTQHVAKVVHFLLCLFPFTGVR